MLFVINSSYLAKRRCIVRIYNEDKVYFCAIGNEFGNIIEIIFKFQGYNTFVTERIWRKSVVFRDKDPTRFLPHVARENLPKI
jgi:predicted metallopeptidase